MSIETSEFTPTSDARSRSGITDMVVPPAMLAVALAAGVAGYLHLGFSAEVASLLSLALFCLMLMCHVLLRAADRADDEADRRTLLVDSPLPRPAPERKRSVRSPSPKAASSPGATGPRRAAEAGSSAPALAPTQPAATSDTSSAPVDSERAVVETDPGDRAALGRVAADSGGQQSARVSPPTPPSMPSTPMTTPSTPTRPLGADRAHSAAAQPQNGSNWTYRPVDLRLPTVDVGSARAADLDAATRALRPTIPADVPAPSAANAEAERIDNILKRLAAQIRAGMSADAPTTSPDHALEKASIVGDPGSPAAAADGDGTPGADAASDAALANAVDALRATVEAMRTGTAPARPQAPPYAADDASTASGAEMRLAAVAEALVAERADVFLEPILGLADDQARHFEVSVRLRATNGDALDARSIAANARGAGLLPLLDAMGVRHSAGFALKLERRGRDGSVFSRVAGESLESETFVSDVAGRHAQGISDRLVLAFDQAEVRGLGPAQLSALAGLNELGFRFALHGIADLDMDFDTLRSVGFEFVKLDAALFLNGLAAGGVEVPASDLCRHFAELGLAVIVGRIEDEKVRARVLGFGAVFGQGALFGAPRPIAVGSVAAAAA